MVSMKIDFHTHTHHSFDSMMKPAKILELAKGRGLDGIVICDHDTIAGGLETQALNDDPEFLVIVGAEIKTDAGDVTGLFLTDEIQSRKCADVCDEIHAQGGKTILNHPYVAHDLTKVDFSKIDYIEGYNGRTSKEKNQLAVDLAELHDLPVVGGSDAHLYGEVARTYTIVDDAVDLRPIRIEGQRSAFRYKVLSQYIKAFKQRRPRVIMGATVMYIKYLLGKK